MGEKIYLVTMFNAGAIDASGNETSEEVDMNSYEPEGYFGLQVTLAGAGSIVQLDYQLSNDGTNWAIPEGEDPVDASITPGSYYIPFSPRLARYLRLKATEIAGNAVTSLTIIMALQ